MYFNEFIGKETISREYKEFSFFKDSLSIDIKQSEKYCETKIFEFNESVFSNLKIYIKEYIPKYTCSFLNSNIEGELFIGINDYGLVKGIPYQGEIDREYIKLKIMKTLKNSIKNDNFDNIDIDIDIEFLEVKSPSKPISEYHEDYIIYLNKKKIFEKKYNEFLMKIEEWKNKYYILNYKLVDIVNTFETRQQLKSFIKENDENNQIINLLNTDYKLPIMHGFEIKDIKLDKNNPYYWVTTFKDKIVDEYKKNKPIFKENFNKSNIPYNLLISLSDMIPYWMNYNKNMNLYVLKIKIKKNKIKNSFLYYDFIHKKWLKCERIILKDQPICLKI